MVKCDYLLYEYEYTIYVMYVTNYYHHCIHKYQNNYDFTYQQFKETAGKCDLCIKESL